MSEGKNHREDLYSKAVRAGKRTYFFDVKTTKGNDLYLTITESKRKYNDDGKFHYEKHKLFLYKEDFDKFSEGLEEAVGKIEELRATGDFSDESPLDRSGDNHYDDNHNHAENGSPKRSHAPSADGDEEFSDVKFEDLED